MKFVIAFALSVFALSSFAAAPQVVDVKVDESGFTPAEIKAPAGSTVALRLTRTSPDTCATAIVIPSMKINEKLPLNKTVTVVLKDLKKGTIHFGCPMNQMLSGNVVVE
jgi:plastocyanin domain-containing protein